MTLVSSSMNRISSTQSLSLCLSDCGCPFVSWSVYCCIAQLFFLTRLPLLFYVCLWLKIFSQLQFKNEINCHFDYIFHHMFGCNIFRSLELLSLFFQGFEPLMEKISSCSSKEIDGMLQSLGKDFFLFKGKIKEIMLFPRLELWVLTVERNSPILGIQLLFKVGFLETNKRIVI